MNSGLALLALASLLLNASGADVTAAAPLTTDWLKPAWQADFSAGVKESNDLSVFSTNSKLIKRP